MQTRIDLWKPDLLELLGRAGCVSIEAGLESLTVEGREMLAKRCRLDTPELAELLVTARRHVPFVQANLIGVVQDDPALVEYWRDYLIQRGVWANKPVPLYPYPSSPSYRAMWGEPDDEAWERAHTHYLEPFHAFSDIQDERPSPCRNWSGHAAEPDIRAAPDPHDARRRRRRMALRGRPRRGLAEQGCAVTFAGQGPARRPVRNRKPCPFPEHG